MAGLAPRHDEHRLMRLRLAATVQALATLLVLIAAPSHAEQPTSWRFAAAETAAATVTLVEPVEIDEHRHRKTPHPEQFIDMAGSYGGVIVRDETGAAMVGFLRIAQTDILTLWASLDASGRALLPAGEYTVTVVGDGPVTVQLPVLGADEPAAVEAREPAPAVDVVHATGEGGVVSAETLEEPLSVTEHSIVVALAVTGGDVQALNAVDMCLRPASFDGRCEEGQGPKFTVISPPTTDAGAMAALFAYPGDFAAGLLDARFDGASVGVMEPRTLFALAVG